jgi:hypothetical protein
MVKRMTLDEGNKTMTKSEKEAADVTALLKARNSLLWVVTREEGRSERYLFEAAAEARYVARTWDAGQGVANMNGQVDETIGGPFVDDILAAIRERAEKGNERGVWILRDLPVWLGGPLGATVLRKVRNLARLLPTLPRERAQAIIVVTTSAEVPADLQGHVTVIEWPLPDRAEIAAALDDAIESLPDNIRAQAAPNGSRDAAIDAAVGLTGEEAAGCYARSLVQLRRIDPVIVSGEKKRIVAREGVLEWFDPLPAGLASVGGLENLKTWLVSRKQAYSPAARAYGLPAPKGAIFVGISGCGKSLMAKAVATAWEVPLLRLDLGALKNKYVGGSEQLIRKALKVVEAIGRCVLWIDEVEKALQGSTSGASDGGTSADQLGTLLNWMQERSGEAFIIATSNDIEQLPPEFLRKGRFDEIWWVDVPNTNERAEVCKAALRQYGRKADGIDLNKVSAATAGFTGAEIAALVPDSLYVAFADGERDLCTADLLEAAKGVVPLTKTAEAKIAKQREWAKGRARLASAAPVVSAEKKGVDRVVLDIS